MIKLTGAVLVLLSSCAIGAILAAQIKEQEKWLKDIKMALFLLSGELEYHQMPLPEALCLVGKRHGGYLGDFYVHLGESLEKKEGIPMHKLWTELGTKYLKDAPLSREQKTEFTELGRYFMETDKNVRKNAVNFYMERLEEEMIQLRETGADRAYLYRTLGMLGGMFLLILVL